MRGAGVDNREEKSCTRAGLLGFSNVGEPGVSDNVDETDRRLVRAGVRVGSAGGPFEDIEERDVVVARDSDGRISGASAASSASGDISLSRDISACFSNWVVAFLSVLSLAFLVSAACSSSRKISTTGSSGVDGVEGTHSDEAEWYVTSDASDDMDIGWAASPVGAETCIGEAGCEPGTDSEGNVGNTPRLADVVNHG